MSTVLWTVGDIADELGIGSGSVGNWANRGKCPEPEFTTAGGTRLWNRDQAEVIIEMIAASLEARFKRKQRREEAARQLEIAKVAFFGER